MSLHIKTEKSRKKLVTCLRTHLSAVLSLRPRPFLRRDSFSRPRRPLLCSIVPCEGGLRAFPRLVVPGEKAVFARAFRKLFERVVRGASDVAPLSFFVYHLSVLFTFVVCRPKDRLLRDHCTWAVYGECCAVRTTCARSSSLLLLLVRTRPVRQLCGSREG